MKLESSTYLSSQIEICKPKELTIDMSRLDVFTQEKFARLQEEHSAAGKDFFVCQVGNHHYFEASRFLEAFIRSKQEGLTYRHPLTREPITTFTVYRYLSDSHAFTLVGNQEDCHTQSPFCIEIILSNPHLEANVKCHLHYVLGNLYETDERDLSLAVKEYRHAASMGHESAMYKLSKLLKKQCCLKESLEWLVKFWSVSGKIPVQGLIDLGQNYEDLSLFSEAFSYFESAARLGNSFATALVVYYLTEGIGREPDLVKADQWRQKLPTAYQETSIEDCLEKLAQRDGACFEQYEPDSSHLKI